VAPEPPSDGLEVAIHREQRRAGEQGREHDPCVGNADPRAPHVVCDGKRHEVSPIGFGDPRQRGDSFGELERRRSAADTKLVHDSACGDDKVAREKLRQSRHASLVVVDPHAGVDEHGSITSRIPPEDHVRLITRYD
jgi:hypothetical protein